MNASKLEILPRRPFPLARSRPRRDSLARPRSKAAFGLWVPLSALAVLLSPLALLSIPFLEVALARRHIAAGKVVLSIGALLFAASGTVIDVDAPGVRVRIRLF